MWSPFRKTSGTARAAAALLLLSLSGCVYGFSAGTGLDLQTIAIVPFENETTRLELTEEIQTRLLQDLPSNLGLVLAGEDQADAVVTGTIRDYALQAPNYRSGGQQGQRPEVLQRQVNLTVAVQVLDVRRNVILWDETSIRTEGQYLEATEEEQVGKELAYQLLVQRIIDGLQSNW